MTSHPCAGHMDQCDHCYTCDVLGVCCQAIGAAQHRSSDAQRPATPSVLHDAIVQDARTATSLSHRIQLGITRPSVPALLPGQPAEPLVTEIRKEPVRVIATRTTR
jgi:hypothetical protein